MPRLTRSGAPHLIIVERLQQAQDPRPRCEAVLTYPSAVYLAEVESERLSLSPVIDSGLPAEDLRGGQ
eukprot:scaffold231703_cov32-Tisochrysis_lutea.AAC.3